MNETKQLRNSEEDVMHFLVQLYDQAKREDEWAETRDMFRLSGVSRVTFYTRLKRVDHLWEKSKEKVVALLRPINRWEDHTVPPDEKHYLECDSFTLLADSVYETNKLEYAVHRLLRLHKMILMTGVADEYQGAYSDLRAKLLATKSLLNQIEEE